MGRKIVRCLAVAWMLASGCGGQPDLPPDPAVRSNPVPVAPVARVQSADGWLDLVAQRPSATLYDAGALVIEPGRVSATKNYALGYRNNWKPVEELDGRQAALVLGRSAALEVPVDGDLSPQRHPDHDGHPGLAMAVTVRSVVPDQSMTVLLNERPLAHLKIGEAWERRTLSLPSDAVRPGDNRIRFHFRRTTPLPAGQAAAAIAMVEVGTHARITAPPPMPSVEDEPRYQVVPGVGRRTTLQLAGGMGLAYYCVPPSRARLVLDIKGAGAFEVRISTSEDHRKGRPPTVVYQAPLRSTRQRSEIDLTAWGRQPIRLELRVRPGGPDVGASLSAARLVARRTIAVDRRPRVPRDIIIVAIEGARADAFDVGRRPALPNIDAMLADALLFERAFSLSPAAVPSHASLLSSGAPPGHLTVRGTFVADGKTMLAEALARGGYYRVLVSSNEDVNRPRGLLQGIDAHQSLGGRVDDHSAVAVTQEVLKLGRDRTETLFAYATMSDPQAPYEPPRDLLRDVVPPEGAPLPHLTHVWVGRVRMGKVEPDPKQLAYVRRLYRGELQVVDDAVGALMNGLQEAGRLESAIVVFVGVHGEEFFEHGGAGHGRSLHLESVQVPLAIRAPEVLVPGRVSVAVDLLDLAPTLADLVGVAAGETWQGESLLPVVDDPQPPPRLVISYLGDGSRMGLVGRQQLILGPGRTEQYFDLSQDPGATQNRLDDGGVGLRIVRAALAWQLKYEDRWRRARWGTGADLKPAFALDLGM